MKTRIVHLIVRSSQVEAERRHRQLEELWSTSQKQLRPIYVGDPESIVEQLAPAIKLGVMGTFLNASPIWDAESIALLPRLITALKAV